MNCTSCGTTLELSVTTCPNCGAHLPYNVPSITEQQPQVTENESQNGEEAVPSAPQPTTPQPQGQQPHRGISGRLTLLLIAIVVLLVGGSGLTYYAAIYQPNQIHAQATTTARANITGTAQANANATASAQTQATAQAQATVTALQNVYTQATSGTPALNDSLASNSANNWTSAGSCVFTGGKLHASGYSICPAVATDFHDFAYQVQMTFVGGDGLGGMIFRLNRANHNFYMFTISPAGTYTFFSGHAQSDGGLLLKILKTGSFAGINTGLNQSNQLAVVAKGNQMYLYINKQYVVLVTDSSSSSGMIGVVSLKFGGSPQVAFNDAEVWKQ
jgi:hypothetical protein